MLPRAPAEGLVSVVIPTYNRRRFVGDAVESVLAQTYQPTEIFVVDDGSTDGTETELARFGDQVQYVRQPNQGCAAARNHGIRLAKGDFIALLDSDDLWDPTKIEKQMALMTRYPQVGVVGTLVNFLNLRTGETRPDPSTTPNARGDLRRRLLYSNCVTGSASAALMRRACFDRVGLFDDQIRTVEDWDMWIRISRYFEFERVEEPLVTIRQHDGSIQLQVERMHRDRLEVLLRAFREDPVDGNNWILFRRSLARLYKDSTWDYQGAGQTRPALRQLLRSLAYWPFDCGSYRGLARMLLQPILPR